MDTLYISDLDGTLLNGNAELELAAKDRLNALIESGMNFTVATARTIASARKILAGVNLKLPLVLMNGAVCYDPLKQHYCKREIMSRGAFLNILRVMREKDIPGFVYTLSGEQLTTYYETLDSPYMREFFDERTGKYYKHFTQIERLENVEGEILYVTVREKRETIAPLAEALKDLPGIASAMYQDNYSDAYYVECYSDCATKFNAVNWLRREFNVARIIGFGDNFNDLPLFAACDESYAVGNAKEEVRRRANGVIGTNLEQGVVRWLGEHTMK